MDLKNSPCNTATAGCDNPDHPVVDILDSHVLLTGGTGFLGSAVAKRLKAHGAARIDIPRSKNSDLRSKEMCDLLMHTAPPYDLVIHAAGNVGGIGKNRDQPYDLWRDNLMMGLHLLDAVVRPDSSVKKMIILGTVCEYPKFALVPFSEDDLWRGYPEETNAPYGIAKKSLLVGGQAARQQFRSNIIHLLPVNLYGPGDNFDQSSSHVIPALIRKIAEAKASGQPSVDIWGSGLATREFLYVDDAAEGIVLAAKHYDKPEPINIGSGLEISIKELAYLIAELMDYQGDIRWDATKPDGQPRRCLNTKRAEKEFGFKAATPFRTGLQSTITWYYKKYRP